MPTIFSHTLTPALDYQITSLLTGHQQVRARELRVHSQRDAVVLEGQVDSWYAKQVAQESIRQISGNVRIVNQLQVVS